MEEIVFLNGKFVPIKETGISVSSPGLLQGFGLFETMRSYNSRIVYLDEHLQRIKKSSMLVGLAFDYSADRMKKIIKKTLMINGFNDSYVRLTILKKEGGTDSLVMVREYHPYSAQKYRRGFRVNISSLRQNENSGLCRIKTTSRIFYEISFQRAKSTGFDEALILNSKGYIAEASRSNIFMVKDKEIFTPSLECGCLDGITRQVVLDLARLQNLKVYQVKLSLQDLLSADEAFLTNSLMGIMPLASVEKHSIGSRAPSAITDFLVKEYNSLLKK